MNWILDESNLNAKETAPNIYTIELSNGKTITVIRDAIRNGIEWAWKVDTQYFSRDSYARAYLKELIAEKLTGKRILFRARGKAPNICGVDGCACRHPGKCNTALCSTCPVADDFFATEDGVELVYAVKKQ